MLHQQGTDISKSLIYTALHTEALHRKNSEYKLLHMRQTTKNCRTNWHVISRNLTHSLWTRSFHRDFAWFVPATLFLPVGLGRQWESGMTLWPTLCVLLTIFSEVSIWQIPFAHIVPFLQRVKGFQKTWKQPASARATDWAANQPLTMPKGTARREGSPEQAAWLVLWATVAPTRTGVTKKSCVRSIVGAP